MALAVKAGADVVVLDGMQGGTAATQEVFIEHVGMPTLACIRPGGAGAAGSRHASQGAADRFRRHSQRRRRRQGAGARRGRGLDRHGGAGRARRQRSRPTRPNTRSSAPRPAPMTTGTRAAIRPASPRRTPSCGAARSGSGRPPAGQLSEGDDAGSANHRARLRQEPCAQSGAGGSVRADRRSRRDGARAARRAPTGSRGREEASRRSRRTSERQEMAIVSQRSGSRSRKNAASAIS